MASCREGKMTETLRPLMTTKVPVTLSSVEIKTLCLATALDSK